MFKLPLYFISDNHFKIDLTDIDSLDESMFNIKNYKSYPKIAAPMIA